jgi:mitochondrial protein import protein ZIM17
LITDLETHVIAGPSFPAPAAAGLRSLLKAAGASDTATEPQDQQHSETTPPPASVPTPESGLKVRDTSNLKISPRHDLAMIFTCKVCETRSMKMASRDSYDNGVVVVRCGGCNNLHLMADRLGWFGEPGSIEDFLATQGEEVKKGSTDTISFTLDDLAGSQVSSKGPSEQN